MASICGITIKGRKKFLDHESFPCYQGNLYLGKQKIASWSQDFMGGFYDSFNIEKGYSEEKLRKAVAVEWKNVKAITPLEKALRKEDSPIALETALGDLLLLMDKEKRFKAAVKAGYIGILETTDGRTTYTWNVPSNYAERVFEEYKEELQKVYDKKFKSRPYITDYFTAGSFDLGAPISIDDIKQD